VGCITRFLKGGAYCLDLTSSIDWVLGTVHSIRIEEIEADFELMRAAGIELIAVGSHDTSDYILDRFKTEFGEKTHTLEVGKWLEIR
jgi:metal-dependent hydrolase (beta-lactamase superfamily II)